MPPRSTQSPGATLIELVVVIAVLGIVAAIGVRSVARAADRSRVRGAAAEVRAALAAARALAVQRAEPGAVRFDTVRDEVSVQLGPDAALLRRTGRTFGVQLSTTRDSAAFGADGLGLGAANLRVVVQRGAMTETVTVSRAGRVR